MKRPIATLLLALVAGNANASAPTVTTAANEHRATPLIAPELAGNDLEYTVDTMAALIFRPGVKSRIEALRFEQSVTDHARYPANCATQIHNFMVMAGYSLPIQRKPGVTIAEFDKTHALNVYDKSEFEALNMCREGVNGTTDSSLLAAEGFLQVIETALQGKTTRIETPADLVFLQFIGMDILDRAPSMPACFSDLQRAVSNSRALLKNADHLPEDEIAAKRDIGKRILAEQAFENNGDCGANYSRPRQQPGP